MTHRLLSRPEPGAAMRPYPTSAIDELQGSGELMWLDVLDPDPGELDALAARFGFDPAAIEDILDVEQFPKFDEYDDHLFVVVHGLTSEGERVDTHEIDCFIADKVLVTVHADRVMSIDWLWKAVQRHSHLAERGSGELFGHLSEVIGRRYFEVANAIESRIDDLAEAALDADPQVLAEIQVLRREESTVRKMLRPQLLVIGELRKRDHGLMGSRAVRTLDDAYDVHYQVVQSLASARGLLTDTLDTYRGAAADVSARATTLLAVYSAILLPLTLITGWYGMNVALPAAERPQAWWIVTIVMGSIAAVSIAVFVRIGLIRPPRARPGRITAGLAGAAKVPVKPFIMLRKPAASIASRRPARSVRSEAKSRPK